MTTSSPASAAGRSAPRPSSRPPRALLPVAALLAAGIPAARGQTPPADGGTPAPPGLVARVNGEEIRRSEFGVAVNQYVMANRLGPDSGISIATIQGTVLDAMIAQILMEQRAREVGITVSDEEVGTQVDALRAEVGSPEDFRLMLTVQNLTEERLRRQLRSDLVSSRLIDAEVIAKIEIPDAEVKRYYDAHREEMTRPEAVRARHVFVRLRPGMTEEERAGARARIDDAKARLDRGEEFARVATAVSEDPAAAQGGDLGWVEEGSVSGPFQLVAFSLPVGAVSDVVATDYGYHIVQVQERRDKRVLPLEEARPSIQARLKDERAPEAVRAYLAELRARANVETFLRGDGPG